MYFRFLSVGQVFFHNHIERSLLCHIERSLLCVPWASAVAADIQKVLILVKKYLGADYGMMNCVCAQVAEQVCRRHR